MVVSAKGQGTLSKARLASAPFTNSLQPTPSEALESLPLSLLRLGTPEARFF